MHVNISDNSPDELSVWMGGTYLCVKRGWPFVAARNDLLLSILPDDTHLSKIHQAVVMQNAKLRQVETPTFPVRWELHDWSFTQGIQSFL